MSKVFKIDDLFKKNLSKKFDKVFCELKVSSYTSISPDFLMTKNYDVEYLDSIENNGTLIHMEGIFRHRSNIYLYLSKENTMEASYQLKIYYEVDKLDEVNFLVKNLIKLG
jgi:hypothetical protein